MTSALLCLATAVYFEARSEPLLGQFAVAEVIVNRAESDRFPDTICGVVTQDLGPAPYDCQFSFYCDGKPEVMSEKAAWERAKAIARDVLNTPDAPDVSGGALFYHTTSVSPRWSRNMEVVASYGKHVFFSDEVTFTDTGV